VKEDGMMLQLEEAKTFFRSWLGLLAFVNDRHKLVKNFGHPKSPLKTDPENVLKIKTELWKNVGIIDEYIDSIWDLPGGDIKILKSWKNRIEGTFIIVRHLKKYSVLMNDANNLLLYGVIGISCPISDMIPADMFPVAVETTLIPFGDRIIYDSLFSMHNIKFGPNMRRDYREMYSKIKEKKGIISTLN
jgi:hypothetical protein